MSWRQKLELPETGDKSDKSSTSVTSVTGLLRTPDEQPAEAGAEIPQQATVPAGTEVSITWDEWKAAALNQLFKEQGMTGNPGRIIAATVRHGESLRHRLDSLATNEQPMSRREVTE
jgi:hypothetical protein